MTPATLHRPKKTRKKVRIGWSLVFFVVLAQALAAVGLSLWFQHDSTALSSSSLDKNDEGWVWSSSNNRRISVGSMNTSDLQILARANGKAQITNPQSTTTASKHNDSYPWQNSSTALLPDWIKEYLDWAVAERNTLTEQNWNDDTHRRRYLVLQCLWDDPQCGGTSDRLKPLPLLLLLAHRTKRLFWIRWTRPCGLEEFLVPHVHGYNWTVPLWMIPHLTNRQENGLIRANVDKLVRDVDKNFTVIRARIQTHDGGGVYFDQEMNGTGVSYDAVYHDLFRILFEPAPPIAKILKTEMTSVGLTPGNYATAHYRAFYGRADRKESEIEEHAINAVNCASQLRPGGPVYFASDSTHAIRVVQKYAKEQSRQIVTIENQKPLHLDKAENLTSRQPSEFYSVFVDLFLLGMGRCGSIGQGGFGKYGLLLSYNASCSNRHIYNRKMQDCTWTDTTLPAIRKPMSKTELQNGG